MDEDVLSYLQSKNLPLKSVSGAEVRMPCFFHGEDPGKRGRLYVNIETHAEIPGLFFCHVCQAKGSLVTIKRHFGDQVEQREEKFHHRAAIFREAADFYARNLSEHPDMVRYLKGPKRGLTLPTIVDAQLGYADGGVSLYSHLRDLGFERDDILGTGLVRGGRAYEDFFTDCITIPYQVAGNVVTIRGRVMAGDDEGKYRTLPGDRVRLYGTDDLWEAERAVICEGEFDRLVAKQLGYHAVGVPGAGGWQEGWNNYFAKVNRVYVLFDPDKAGRNGAQTIRENLGPKVRLVDLPTPEGDLGKGPDFTDLVTREGWDKPRFDELMERAKGGLLITIDEAWTRWEELQTLEGLQTGYEMFDQIIRPGVLPGQVVVILAKTGVGKSISLINIAHNILEDPEKSILFFSLELTAEEMIERFLRVHRFHNLDANDADFRDHYRERLIFVDQNRVSGDQFVGAVEDFRFETGRDPDAIMVDYLGYFARSFQGEEYQRISDAMMLLKALGKDLRKPIFTPHQVNRTQKAGQRISDDGGRGSGVVEETADFLLSLYSPDDEVGKQVDQRKGTVNMEILKSRHGGKGSQIPLQFAPVTLALLQHDDPLWGRARAEVDYRALNDDWRTTIKRHAGEYADALA